MGSSMGSPAEPRGAEIALGAPETVARLVPADRAGLPPQTLAAP